MDLIERTDFLETLQTKFRNTISGEGHCILLTGEAGIGKTSLIKTFCKGLKNNYKFYQGTCDALFTPRPLAPLYDILWQFGNRIETTTFNISDRVQFFSRFYHELAEQTQATLFIIEDVHWADEATLDFIKFLARRITNLHCLFILSYRDNEIGKSHPLRSVLGQMPVDSFTRMQLTPLSKQAVEKLAGEKGYKGEDVYSISGGNPFYVNEILASYSTGVPDNIKDSILSSYNRLDDETKQIWQILSVLPTGFEIKYLEKMEPSYAAAIHNCLDLKILIPKNGLISFKHELFRRTIESSLSPLLRVALNKRILELFRDSFEQNGEIERIIHHAKNANEYETVVHYAPRAAKQAAALGAHIEAAKLYLTAIDYYQGNDKDLLIQFYEAYAYECYLTNQIKDAIIYTERAMNIWRGKKDIQKTANAVRFLSRLWRFDGNAKKSEAYALEAIELLKDQPSSAIKAMAYSNMAQLKMLSEEANECILWGEKAIEMSNEIGDEEILSHALNNLGTMLSIIRSSRDKGIELLQRSLQIAIKNSYQEHVARAYSNLVSGSLSMRDYNYAKEILKEAVQYCEEKDLDSWETFIRSSEARLYFETGNWKEALHIAQSLLENEEQTRFAKVNALLVDARIRMRKGDLDVLPSLFEMKTIGFETMELQAIIPSFVALLEYEWITGNRYIEEPELERVISIVERIGNVYGNSEFAYWLLKARNRTITLKEFYDGFITTDRSAVVRAVQLWKQLGCPYEQALILFDSHEDDKREAISIMHELGATAIYEKMKFEMKASGIKNIPRGIRKTTQSNPAHLTDRELDVLQLLKEGLQNKEIGARLFISPKTVDHHISSIFFKLDVNSRAKAVQEARQLDIIK